MRCKSFLTCMVGLVFRPDAAWRSIAAERSEPWRHVVVHALVLAAAGPLALALGLLAFGTPIALGPQSTPMSAGSPMALAVGDSFGTAHLPFAAPSRAVDFGSAVATAGMAYLCLLAALAGIALIYWLLAPACDARRSAQGALRVAVFGMTPLCLSAVGLCHPDFYLLLAIGLMHSTVVTHAGARIVLGAPSSEAAVLIGLTAIAFQIGAPLAAYGLGALF